MCLHYQSLQDSFVPNVINILRNFGGLGNHCFRLLKIKKNSNKELICLKNGAGKDIYFKLWV